MTDAVIDLAGDPMVLTFAEVESTSQRLEIAQTRDLLDVRRP
jgi:hypothetical protein